MMRGENAAIVVQVLRGGLPPASASIGIAIGLFQKASKQLEISLTIGPAAMMS